jgi:hypothetical protein
VIRQSNFFLNIGAHNKEIKKNQLLKGAKLTGQSMLFPGYFLSAQSFFSAYELQSNTNGTHL